MPTLVEQCLSILKKDDIRNEIKIIFQPTIELLLNELYPYIYVIILIIVLLFILILTNLILQINILMRIKYKK